MNPRSLDMLTMPSYPPLMSLDCLNSTGSETSLYPFCSICPALAGENHTYFNFLQNFDGIAVAANVQHLELDLGGDSGWKHAFFFKVATDLISRFSGLKSVKLVWHADLTNQIPRRRDRALSAIEIEYFKRRFATIRTKMDEFFEVQGVYSHSKGDQARGTFGWCYNLERSHNNIIVS